MGDESTDVEADATAVSITVVDVSKVVVVENIVTESSVSVDA